MFVNFDIENLNAMLFHFHNITGMTVSIWDADYNQLAFQPPNIPRFCNMIKSTKEGLRRCTISDKAICKACATAKHPMTHKCHAGLVDTAIPILHENNLLGFMMFGQIKDENISIASFQEVWDNCKNLEIDKDTLMKSYSELRTFNQNIVVSAAHILNACTQYLWLSKIISLNNNILATKIDSYITQHLSDQITIPSLCKNFHISKNKLQAVSKTNFGDTIGNYIINKRIQQAKLLLQTKNEPIYQIAVLVGIPDYNYFIKVFKRVTGITPYQYQLHH